MRFFGAVYPVVLLLSAACGRSEHHDDRALTDANAELQSKLDGAQKDKDLALTDDATSKQERDKANAAAQAAAKQRDEAKAEAAAALAKADEANKREEATRIASDNTRAGRTAAEERRRRLAAEDEVKAWQAKTDELNQTVANLTAAVDAKKAAVATLNNRVANIKSALKALLPSEGALNDDRVWPGRMAELLRRIATASDPVSAELRLALRSGAGLPADASDDALVAQVQRFGTDLAEQKDQVQALTAQLASSKKAQDDLSQKWSAALADKQALLATEADRVLVGLTSFSGIWLADGDEAMGLSKDCFMMMRVTAKPAQILRAILCANGTVETSVAPVERLTTEASRFPGGFQFTAQLGAATTSCGTAHTSTFAAQTPLAFDLKTAAGGEAATFAYSVLGGQEIAMHSTGAVDGFGRSRSCSSIIATAARAGDAPDTLALRLAAKVCQIDGQKAGCYTSTGYVAP